MVEVTAEAASQIKLLFAHYLANPNDVPAEFRVQDLTDPHRRIAHYIAGMTDRFARKEFSRIKP